MRLPEEQERSSFAEPSFEDTTSPEHLGLPSRNSTFLEPPMSSTPRSSEAPFMDDETPSFDFDQSADQSTTTANFGGQPGAKKKTKDDEQKEWLGHMAKVWSEVEKLRHKPTSRHALRPWHSEMFEIV